MSGLIIEGVCATGKSTIFNNLIDSNLYRLKKSKIQLNEHLTERIIENINPTLDQRINLLEKYVDMFEEVSSHFYNSRFRDTKSKEIIPCYLVERFHFTHAIEEKSFDSFKNIDDRLKKLNFKVIVLSMEKDCIKDRLEDTFKRRNKMWYNYVMSFGGIEGASKRYFNMQERLLEYIDKSSLPVKIVNTTDMKWDKYINEIEEFWDI
ncbi:hypothetical protein GOQ27_00575 [Clostridium sp. D2Q-11]|uniref:Uncharacterized protein n=1 Tax=Anaeromonas frigoriresistens TaxID=2683708 RepID=A0A942Z769_9FIRM|nr:hypothetical protein [Anaeromonas frigoriresistens]MBS4536933.1 hypothetical protein [Anaeromonas frigoriresistens]